MEIKLFVRSIDGTSVMAGEKTGVQFRIRQIHLNTLFVHCYAHRLNLVLLHGAKTIKSVNLQSNYVYYVTLAIRILAGLLTEVNY